MKALSRITIYGAFLMALSGPAFGQSIQTDFDHQADFSQYQTYSWQTIKSVASLWDARIKNAINGQLEAKGWTQVDNGAANTQPASKASSQEDNGPDFPFPPPPLPAAAKPETSSSCLTSAPCVVIVAIQTTETQRSLQGFYSGLGGGWGSRGFGGGDGQINITEQDYKEGTLVVDV